MYIFLKKNLMIYEKVITTPGPLILGAASFWYSITGWDESLLMSDDGVLNLRLSPTRG